MDIYIKNMVCTRCVLVVQSMLDDWRIRYKSVELGMVITETLLTNNQIAGFGDALKMVDLELIDNKKNRLIETVRRTIIDHVYHTEERLPIKFSEFLSHKLGYHYNYLANIFSQNQGITIEKFIIVQRIERVKALIIYNDMNLSEIALCMDYSSVAHLSRQFKQITGITPTEYKTERMNIRDIVRIA